MDEEEQIIRLPKRYCRDYCNPFECYNNEQFKRRYRFSKDCVINILHPLIESSLEGNLNCRGLLINSMHKLLIALQFYGSNCFQIIGGDLGHVSQSTVSLIIKEISRCFARHLPKFVNFPKREKAKDIIKFYEISNFPNVIGVIDCTHIWIKNPGNEYAEVFRNRKSWFSINVQHLSVKHLSNMRMYILNLNIKLIKL
ncbi:putative nuclease HARBI1 [Prorops nasuta]|uniref:putative nuclease HARBI1 n=1 Tax=Prorops nasuta TaxID=863751 RepID=UPI0034CE4FC0